MSLLFRNPNEPPEPEHGGRQERSRFKNIEWTAYEPVHKKYLNIDTKPKLKNHYRAHRLSFWLNLVPDLHKPGSDDIPNSHHEFDDTEDLDTMEPTVKPLNPPHQREPPMNYSIFTTQVFSLLNLSSSSIHGNSSGKYSSQHKIGTSLDHDGNESGGGGPHQPQQEDGFAAYSTALSVTIAIGCSLLILNVLIFAGVYYQRDKTRLNEPRNSKKRNTNNGQMPNNICGDLENLTIHTKSDPTTILGHHHAMQHHQMPPPEFADIPQRAPPPPKHLMKSGMMSVGMDGSLLAQHQLQVMGSNCTGNHTLKNNTNCMKNSNNSSMGTNSQNPIDELRV